MSRDKIFASDLSDVDLARGQHFVDRLDYYEKVACLPTANDERKKLPVATGVVDYFPLALAAIAALSYYGNEKHNPGEPMHWARGKSTDHSDALLRHFIDRGGMDTDGHRHSTHVAWRALAILQLEIEADRASTKA